MWAACLRRTLGRLLREFGTPLLIGLPPPLGAVVGNVVAVGDRVYTEHAFRVHCKACHVASLLRPLTIGDRRPERASQVRIPINGILVGSQQLPNRPKRGSPACSIRAQYMVGVLHPPPSPPPHRLNAFTNDHLRRVDVQIQCTPRVSSDIQAVVYRPVEPDGGANESRARTADVLPGVHRVS